MFMPALVVPSYNLLLKSMAVAQLGPSHGISAVNGIIAARLADVASENLHMCGELLRKRGMRLHQVSKRDVFVPLAAIWTMQP